MTPRTRAALRRCLASPRVVIGLALIAAAVAVAILAPFLAPHDPQEQDLLNTLLPPAWAAGGVADYPLGTDSLGRCVLSRLFYGARVALYVAALAATGAALLGAALALVAGYFGGWVDWLVSRLVDIWMAFPPVILALILLVGLGAGVNKVVLAIVLIDWTRFCRVLRSEVIVVRRRDYVAAARLAGFTHAQTILREVLPAVLPLLITLFSLEMGIAVIVEAIMSFVGLSVEPNVAAWGVMIADARQTMNQAPWGVVAPVLAIFVTVLAFNLTGDGLRRALDPRLVTSRGEA
ncbi:ABC transporter permease [Alsobacter sp. SYSU M60028]|uniref:ABC transporter permease n=1 Tax=Alsobacter ponti TaxID=2962936 RepID=A0ABT1L937_9HYPH|nr:ABC transporter permease [Alsobacter ponti]MCP8937944.1 ABC transporter permease [Alsobacter ponti]